MRSSLAATAVTLLLGAGLLTSCSDDADEKKATAPAIEAAEPAVTKGCQADVTVTGAVKASWSGKATVRLSDQGPAAVYETKDGKAQLSVYSAGEEFDPSANFTSTDGVTYTTAMGDATGLDIEQDGTGAEVAAPAQGIEGPGIEIEATFECAKPKKKATK